jgi:transposase
MGRRSKYPPELRERAVRLARGSDRPISAVARDLGVHRETLRTWVRQDEADDGTRADQLTTAEREELTALRKEVRDLRRSNEILNAASVSFARELDQPRPR